METTVRDAITVVHGMLYRALPPAGTHNLAGYPQRLLLASPLTAGWHELG